jgi:hypothetical protein
VKQVSGKALLGALDSFLVMEIRKTDLFSQWLAGLRDLQARA